MPNLVDTITALFRRNRQERETTTLDSAKPVQQSYHALAHKLAADTERRAIIETSRKMYKTDARIRGVCNAVGRDAAKGGFTISVANNPEAEEIANDLIKRLRLFKRLDDWIRLTVRDGDSFIEVGVNADGLITKVHRKPTLQMNRHSNDNDEFDEPTLAFWQYGRPIYANYIPADAVWFAEWQIVHARWAHDEGDRYGEPLFGPSTGPFKRTQQGEVDMAIRRSTRSGMKYLHIIEGASEEELAAYRERNKDSAENPLSAVTDFYSSKPGSLQTVQGDANLGEITDVRHHISTMWLSSPVPMALLGYGEDLNRDVLEEQTEQYHSALESITGWISDELVIPLLERQWLLAGIWPEHLDYSIEWASKKTVSTQTLMQLAQAIGLMVSSGMFTDETIYRIVARFLPGFDWRADLEAMEQKREQEQQDQVALDRLAAQFPRANRQQAPEEEPEEIPASEARQLEAEES